MDHTFQIEQEGPCRSVAVHVKFFRVIYTTWFNVVWWRCGNYHTFQIEQETKLDLPAELHTKDGPRWSTIQTRKTVNPVTTEPAILYSARDMSDAILAKKEREASEQKSEVSSHYGPRDLDPLHHGSGFIDLLDQTTDLDKEQRSYVKLLKSCTQGLSTVISDILR